MVTVPHDDNRAELAARLGGAVHQVGGPPAILRTGPHEFAIGELADVRPAVEAVWQAGGPGQDWTVYGLGEEEPPKPRAPAGWPTRMKPLPVPPAAADPIAGLD